MRLNIRGRARRPAGENGSITLNIARESLIEIRTHGRNTVNQDPALRIEKITGEELLIQGVDRAPTGKTFPARGRLLASNPVDRMPLRVRIEGEKTPE